MKIQLCVAPSGAATASDAWTIAGAPSVAPDAESSTMVQPLRLDAVLASVGACPLIAPTSDTDATAVGTANMTVSQGDDGQGVMRQPLPPVPVACHDELSRLSTASAAMVAVLAAF